MMLRAVFAALILTAALTACTIQRVPTDCLAAPVPTVRTKNKAFGYVPTSIAERPLALSC